MSNRQAKVSWFAAPTKMNVVLFLALWIVSTGLVILALSDLFTANPFRNLNLPLVFLLFLSTGSTVKIVLNYMRSKRDKNT